MILNGSRWQGGAVPAHDLVPLLACLSAELDDSGIDLLLLSRPAGAERALARGFLAGRFSAAILLDRDLGLQAELESCGAPYALLSELMAPQASSAKAPAGHGAAGGLGDRVGPLPAGSAAGNGFPARAMSANLLRRLFPG